MNKLADRNLLPSPPLRGRGAGGEGARVVTLGWSRPLTPNPSPPKRGRGEPAACPLLFVALLLVTAGRASADPVLAVVRIPSHGASATVIETRPGYSLLLGCAHAFEGADRARPIHLDVPVAQAGPPRRAAIRLLAVDYRADLSLVVLEDGPLAHVAPVAPAGHAPSRNVLSIGYDEMRWPAQTVPATILGGSGMTTLTRERPWHGRSGGALLDAEHGVLIGVVQGYEVGGARRGMYVSHPTILRFLQRQRAAPPPAPRPDCPT